METKEKELSDAYDQIAQMKDTLKKVLSARPEDCINTASTLNIEDDQGYFGSYSSVDIHYEMLKVNNCILILLLLCINTVLYSIKMNCVLIMLGTFFMMSS